MNRYLRVIGRLFLGCVITTLLLVVAPPSAMAGTATLELVNNRQEIIRVAYSTWDADRNTHFTRGWIAVKPKSNVVVSIASIADYSEIVSVFAKSASRVWEGVDDIETKEIAMEQRVRSTANFQYWDTDNIAAWKDIKRYKFLNVHREANGNFKYVFE